MSFYLVNNGLDSGAKNRSPSGQPNKFAANTHSNYPPMIPVKIQCGCGQKYAFDVEPVGTFPPRSVSCPVCGADGTASANQFIAQRLTSVRPAAAMVAAAPVANAAPSVGLATSASGAGVSSPPIPAPSVAPTSPPTAPPVRVSTSVAAVPAIVPSAVRPATQSSPSSVGASTLPGRLDRDRAIAEARSKIMWGDDQKDVAAFLRMQGLPAGEAATTVKELLDQRASTIRGEGVAKIIKGIACICVPIIAFVSFLSMKIMPVKILGITVMIGCYGLYLFINGMVMFLSPRSESGDVADK